MALETQPFDGGPDGAAIPVAGDIVEVSGAVFTNAAAHGPFAARIPDNVSFLRVKSQWGYSSHSGSLYFKVVTNPGSGAARFLNFTNDVNGVRVLVRAHSNGQIQIANSANTEQAATVGTFTVGQWHRLDWQFDASGANPILTVRVFFAAESATTFEEISWVITEVAWSGMRWQLAALSTPAWAADHDTLRVVDALQWVGPFASTPTEDGGGRYDFRVDWDSDGDMDGPAEIGENITRRALTRSPITIQYGRDQARSLAPIQAGRANFEVNNESRDYSPENAASPLAGLLGPGRAVRISHFDRDNAVANPSFEEDFLPDWQTVNSSLAVNTASVLFGTRAMNVTLTDVIAIPSVSSTVDGQVRVVAGETYTVSIWDRFGGAGTRSVSIRLIFRDDANVIIENPTAITQTTTGGTYVRLSRTLTAPAGATRAQIIMAFHLNDAVVGDVHTFDGVMVEHSASLGDYFDGDISGAQWLGEPHASPSMIGHILFRGHLDGYDVLPDIDQRSVRLSAMDVIGRFRGVTLSTGLFPADKTGRAIHRVLDQLRWPQDLRDIDVGATTIRWWWEEGTDAFTALERIVASEGPGALATVDTAGRFVFRSRHHRLTAEESLNVQATFRGEGTEPLFSAPLIYDVGWRDIVNSVRFDVAERDPDNNRSDVWSDGGIIRLADGETITVTAQASDPFTGAVTPLVGVDYTLGLGAVTMSLSRTNGQSTQIRITAIGGPAEVEGLKLRAFAVTVKRTIQIRADDAESITKHGIRSYGRDAPWLNIHDAAAVAAMILAHRAKRSPTVTIRLVSGEAGNPARFAQQLSRNLSDRIHIVGSDADIDDDFHLEQIQHTIAHAGKSHETRFGCEKVATQPTDVFILDVSRLDVGQLGVQGLDDPERIFIFDHATQGQFNVGLFAH